MQPELSAHGARHQKRLTDIAFDHVQRQIDPDYRRHGLVR